MPNQPTPLRKTRLFTIEDETHCDYHGDFQSFRDALCTIIGFSTLAWDETPNRAPCRTWRKCGRKFQIVEAETWMNVEFGKQEYRHIQTTLIGKINADGFLWLHDSGSNQDSGSKEA